MAPKIFATSLRPAPPFGQRAFGALSLSAAALVLAAPAVSQAAAASPADQAFVTQAAQGGMAEVADGKLALSHSSDANVKAFASKMIADHDKANAKLESIARADGFALPASVGAENATMKAALVKLHGKTFDTSYLQGQQQGHEKMEQVMRTEIASGKNAALVTFAKQTLPTVESHLSLAKADMQHVEAGTSGGASMKTAPGDVSTPAAVPAPMATQT